MAWERGRYYTHSQKVAGRVVRTYLGKGRTAELIAQQFEREREQRRLVAQALAAEKAELDALDAELEALDEVADLVARAALLAAGFYQHKRCEWRRRRGPEEATALI